MGVLHVHGRAAGSLALADLVAPFQVPLESEIFIDHLKTTLEGAGTNTAFVLETSDDSGFVSFQEIDRQFMTSAGTFISTENKVEVGPGKWVRVRYVQTVLGLASISLIGSTRGAGLQIGV